MEALQEHSWPGNVRELQNAIERAVLLCDGTLIGSKDLTLDSATTDSRAATALETLNLEVLEKTAIERALKVSRGVQKDAADLLGVTPRVLNYKIQTLGIDWKSFRTA